MRNHVSCAALAACVSLFASCACAQTYNPLACGINRATTPPTMGCKDGATWKIIGRVTSNALVPAAWQEVASNAALKSETLDGKSAGHAILRKGFTTPGDGGEMVYYLSTSACSISGGNDFTQVAPNSGTGCWIAETRPGYDLRAAGMIAGDNTTNAAGNAAVMTKIFAEPSGPLMVTPEDLTFRLACGTQYSAAAGVHFWGAWRRTGTIKFNPGCTFTGTDVFAWDGKSGGGSIGVIWDFNTPAVPASTVSLFGCKAYAAPLDGCVFEDNKFLNTVTKMLIVSGAANGGRSLSNFAARRNYFAMTPATSQNHCILLTTVDLAGSIPDAVIEDNICDGTTIQIDGARTIARRNDISGFEFGNGIFSGYATGSTPSNTDCIIEGNRIHDTGAGLDVNGSSHGGFENNCFNSTVTGNRFDNLGGSAINNFAGLAIYEGNRARGVGKGYDASPINRAAFGVTTSALPTATSAKTIWIDNVAIDDGSSDGGTPDTPAMLHGIYIAPSLTGEVLGKNNRFDISGKLDANGKLLASRIGGGTLAKIDSTFTNYAVRVSNLVASAAAIAFPPLDILTFKNWFLNCRNVVPVSADTPQVQVSKDGGATWNTAGSYVSSGFDWNNGAAAGFVLTTATGIKIGNTTWDQFQAKHGAFTIRCRDLDGTISKKSCAFDGDARNNATGANLQINGSGYWNADALALNDLRVNMAGGSNWFGSCTLEGRIN